eukprot:TRINITY_DN3611_c0_g1_i16.p1 TRINITY_DN3611_c0_g1~~TRINITY_DN3611_c0_g1_i16.p1  ORF type:complete len:198 (+),score=40.74 TRINITY_DN3611_c0_g1_i16:340-933(+)
MEGYKLSREPVLTYQTSSIGMLKRRNLNFFYRAWAGSKEITKPVEDLPKYLEIQFPTKAYIDKVTLGQQSASCILLSAKAYHHKEFPRDCLCQLTPIESHKNDLFHTKAAILAANHEIDDDTAIYIGSHNISESAWGRIERKNSQLCIANYEVGIVFPPEKGSKRMKEEILEALAFTYPPAKYDQSDLPWIHEQHFT